MKKYLSLSLFLLFPLLVVSGFMQPASGASPSYYASELNSPNGLVTNYSELVLFDSSMFDTAALGVFVMNGDTLSANGYAGLVRVTGSCYADKPSVLQMVVITDAGRYVVASTAPEQYVFDMMFVTASPWLQIGVVSREEGRYTLLKCWYLFEALE